jgi:hypothetical protein
MRAVAHTQPRDTSADTTPPVADALLIRHSLREPERFTEVFDRHYAEIHGYVARRLGPSLAEDVASETFLIAFDRRRLKAGNSTGEVRKGSTVIAERLATAIVDKPGQTR